MMISVTAALHNAVRHYCRDRDRHWRSVYDSVSEDSTDTYHYSDRQVNVFSRYNLLHAICVAVESLDPETLEDFETTRWLLVSLGQSAHDGFPIGPWEGIEKSAQDEERKKFSLFVRQLNQTSVWNFDALPYQRVLSDDEASAVWSNLQRWGVKREDDFYPFAPTAITGLIAFDSDVFHAAVPAHALSKILASRNISRIWEMREYGPSYILDVCTDPIFAGAEGCWTSSEIDWLIYASPERTITIGGWMVEAVKNIWPKLDQHQFKPFFLNRRLF